MKKEKLSKQYKVSLPSYLEQRFRELSISSGKSMSFVLRECLAKSKPVFREAMPVCLQKERLRALRIMANAGNNLNQVARHLNTLNLKNELNYDDAIHYLRLLDTIEARLHHYFLAFNIKC